MAFDIIEVLPFDKLDKKLKQYVGHLRHKMYQIHIGKKQASHIIV
jgi:hypothetical protein